MSTVTIEYANITLNRGYGLYVNASRYGLFIFLKRQRFIFEFSRDCLIRSSNFFIFIIDFSCETFFSALTSRHFLNWQGNLNDFPGFSKTGFVVGNKGCAFFRLGTEDMLSWLFQYRNGSAAFSLLNKVPSRLFVCGN